MEHILQQAIANLQNVFPGEVNTGELLSRVKEVLLMEDTEYKIINVEGTTTKFKASIKVNFKNEADVNLFIKDYSLKNNETLRILKMKKSQNENTKTVFGKVFQVPPQHET